MITGEANEIGARPKTLPELVRRKRESKRQQRYSFDVKVFENGAGDVYFLSGCIRPTYYGFAFMTPNKQIL
jgi:hypothetical protein